MPTKSTLSINAKLLAIIGRRIPAIYDAIIPRFGPQPEPWSANRLAWAALNPQPLPPHELGAAVAAEFIHAVWFADRLGLDMARINADLDDWCPTHPRHIKVPPWWPPIPDPEPHPEWYVAFHLGFAARLATVSLEGAKAGKAINNAIERSLAAMESAAK